MEGEEKRIITCQQLRKIFKAADSNGDNTLNEAEFAHMMHEGAKYFKKYDLSGDGEITEDEAKILFDKVDVDKKEEI